MSLSTIEVISLMYENNDKVCEAVSKDVEPVFMKSLFLFVTMSISGYKHLVCIEEPLDSCIPHVMVARGTIPLESHWDVSIHDKKHIQNLIDKIGINRSIG